MLRLSCRIIPSHQAFSRPVKAENVKCICYDGCFISGNGFRYKYRNKIVREVNVSYQYRQRQY
jgi:hypothetical protein